MENLFGRKFGIGISFLLGDKRGLTNIIQLGKHKISHPIYSQLGNKLGNYFNELACAELVGLNFVSISKQWDLNSPGAHKETAFKGRADARASKLAFLNSLPDIVVHPSPSTEAVAKEKLNGLCKCEI